MVTIDVAGPGHPKAVDIVPDDLRAVIGFVIDECVQLRGEGGYTTRGMANVFDWLLSGNGATDAVRQGGTPLWSESYRKQPYSITKVRNLRPCFLDTCIYCSTYTYKYPSHSYPTALSLALNRPMFESFS